MNVIVAGCRTFDNYELLEREMLSFAGSMLTNITIVSGGAKGVDALGERFAAEHNLPVIVKPAEWDLYGRAAGPIRNIEMARISDALVAFWDGKSKGTKNMIELAKKHGLRIKMVKI